MATRTRLQLAQAIGDNLGIRLNGTLTAATATLLTIATGNSARVFRTNRVGASDRTLEGAEIYVTSGTAPVPNPNSISATDVSAGTLTPGVDYGTVPGATATFDVWLKNVSYNDVIAAIDDALRNLRYGGLWPLTLVVDGDMEASGTGDWTSNVATLSKVTAVGNVLRGNQALRVLATAANGEARSTTINVDPTYGSTWWVQARVRAAVGTARLIAYDLTNAANIDTQDWTNQGWGLIGFNFQLPATAEQLQVRLRSVANADDAFWEDVIAFPAGLREIPLPAWVIREGDIKRVMHEPAATGPRRYDETRLTEHFRWEPLRNEINANNMFNLLLDPGMYGPTWIEASRSFDALAADGTTTFAERDWIELAGAMELCKRMARKSRGTVNYLPWVEQYSELRRDLKRQNSQLMPGRRIHMLGGSPNGADL